MNGAVNWPATLEIWKQSVGASTAPVTDAGSITFVVDLLKWFALHGVEDESIKYLTGRRATNHVLLSPFDPTIVLDVASSTLDSHRHMWTTHHDQVPERMTFEFPVVMYDSKIIRYFKVQFASRSGTLPAEAKEVKTIYLSFHDNNFMTEAVYE